MLFDAVKDVHISIKDIDLSGNQTIDNNCMKSLGELIQSSASISVIYLNNNQIEDSGIKTLAPYMEGNTSLKYIYLHNNRWISDDSLPVLTKIIEITHIQDICIDGTFITKKNALKFPLVCNTIKFGVNKIDLKSR